MGTAGRREKHGLMGGDSYEGRGDRGQEGQTGTRPHLLLCHCEKHGDKHNLENLLGLHLLSSVEGGQGRN